jgi:hypothetical protein
VVTRGARKLLGITRRKRVALDQKIRRREFEEDMVQTLAVMQG